MNREHREHVLLFLVCICFHNIKSFGINTIAPIIKDVTDAKSTAAAETSFMNFTDRFRSIVIWSIILSIAVLNNSQTQTNPTAPANAIASVFETEHINESK